jgi:hypothetical protein
MIYREGTPRPGNLVPRPVDKGHVSFRASLSNPYPLLPGQRPVFRPGQDYFGIAVDRLSAGSVIYDNQPDGHVSVVGVSAEDLRNAVIERGRFPGVI